MKVTRLFPKGTFGQILVILCLGLAALASSTLGQRSSSGYHLLKTVKLGGMGGWDYLAIDPGGEAIVHFASIRNYRFRRGYG